MVGVFRITPDSSCHKSMLFIIKMGVTALTVPFGSLMFRKSSADVSEVG